MLEQDKQLRLKYLNHKELFRLLHLLHLYANLLQEHLVIIMKTKFITNTNTKKMNVFIKLILYYLYYF